jgi:uncharacterized RDD family membrane protein YckC
MRFAKRCFAFLIDVALLWVALAFLMLFRFSIGGGSPSTGLALAASFSIALYFVLQEVLCGGKTLGRRLFRIQLRDSSGAPVTAYQSALRVWLLMFSPALAAMVVSLAGTVVFLPDLLTTVADWAFVLASVVLWPATILINGGTIGLHDLLARTAVTPYGEKQARSALTVRQLTIAAIAIVAVCAAIASPPTRAARRTLEAYRKKVSAFEYKIGKSTATTEISAAIGSSDLVVLPQDLEGRIEGIARRIGPCPRGAEPDYYALSVYGGLVPESVTAAFGPPPSCVTFSITMSPRGFNSVDAYRYLEPLLMKRMLPLPRSYDRRRVRVAFEYVNSQELGFAFLTKNRRRVGYMSPATDSTHAVSSLDPDGGQSFAFGLLFSTGWPFGS